MRSFRLSLPLGSLQRRCGFSSCWQVWLQSWCRWPVRQCIYCTQSVHWFWWEYLQSLHLLPQDEALQSDSIKSIVINSSFTASEIPWSCGCTQKVWKVRKKDKNCTRWLLNIEFVVFFLISEFFACDQVLHQLPPQTLKCKRADWIRVPPNSSSNNWTNQEEF